MAVKPVPRKRRREKDRWQTTVISVFAASLYPLAKIAAVFLLVALIAFIVYLISGDLSGFWRFVGSEALFLPVIWLVYCLFVFIPIIISQRTSGGKDYPSDDGERVDKIDRNISRRRLAKQKTLAKEAAKRKQKKK